jgi:prophage maintenance system killer protein
VLLYSLAKSQACIDGNKRIALILMYAFLDLNDARLDATSNDVADRILDVAESDPADRENRIRSLTEWLRDSVREDA